MTLRYILLGFVLLGAVYSLSVHQSDAEEQIQKTLRTVKFYDGSVFFTTNDRRAFGYLNATDRGTVEQIYILDQNQRIVDEFQASEGLVIANQNKSLIHFNPEKRELRYDERFINQNFTSLKGFKELKDRAYVITEDSIRYYFQYAPNEWRYQRQLISQATLNPGVQQFYYDLYYFPSKKFPDRVLILTTAIFEDGDKGEDKLLSCFKWFVGEQQQVDGACSYEKSLNIQDFRITAKWAYMKIDGRTHVYDETLTMKTRWQNIPTQFVAGHAVTSDHLTYLFKTNELVYYRLVENYKNDDIKMTLTDKNINIMRDNKRFVKFNKGQNAEPIGSWVEEIDETTIRIVIQFNNGELHCYKVIRSQASTQINYLFRLSPKKRQKPQQVAAQQPKPTGQEPTPTNGQPTPTPDNTEQPKQVEQKKQNSEL